jgi:hypothetical protein
MKESAEESDLLCFRRPVMVSLLTMRNMSAVKEHTENDLATVEDAYYLVPRRSV